MDATATTGATLGPPEFADVLLSHCSPVYKYLVSFWMMQISMLPSDCRHHCEASMLF